ncbi:MAG TPA: hypothetical protein VIX37_19140 [Candidatus Sulfotelmatobacter sp.]
MRPLSFRPDELRLLLLRNKIATLDELKQALGTAVDVTVFRKLKLLDYSPATRIAAATIPCVKSPALTTADCGHGQRPGFPASARCWPLRKDSSIVPRAGTSPMSWLRSCTL